MWVKPIGQNLLKKILNKNKYWKKLMEKQNIEKR